MPFSFIKRSRSTNLFAILGLFTVLFFISIPSLDLREQPWISLDWNWHPSATHATQFAYNNVLPATHFRDSLSPSKKYITAFVSAGITNQIISDLHLIELAKLTGRIPILSPFAPIHTSLLAGYMPFSEVFDIDRLEHTLGFEVLEWGGNPNTSLNPTNSKYSHRNHIIKDTLGLTHPTLAPLSNSPSSPSIGELQNIAYSSISSSKGTDSRYFSSFFLGAPDTLGCWSLTMGQLHPGTGPRDGGVPPALNLAVSWMPVPPGRQAIQGHFAVALEELAKLGQSNPGPGGAGREIAISDVKAWYLENLENMRSELSDEQRKKEIPFTEVIPSRAKLDIISPLWETTPAKGWAEREGDGEGKQIEPDDQVLCFDYLLYSSFRNNDTRDVVQDSIERAFDTVGMDLHFSKRLLDITADILHTTIFHQSDFSSNFPSNPDQDTNPFPPYIAVHARRNDFDQFCKGRDPRTCFTPLTTYASAVSSIRADLLTRNPSLTQEKVDSIPVILFSDEPKHMNPWFKNRYHRPDGFSEKFWEDVGVLGWKTIDHETAELMTEERWGYWYPILVDSAVMGHAVGYVGTSKSTFSLIGAKRVAKWWNGPIRMVDAVVPMDS